MSLSQEHHFRNKILTLVSKAKIVKIIDATFCWILAYCACASHLATLFGSGENQSTVARPRPRYLQKYQNRIFGLALQSGIDVAMIEFRFSFQPIFNNKMKI